MATGLQCSRFFSGGHACHLPSLLVQRPSESVVVTVPGPRAVCDCFSVDAILRNDARLRFGKATRISCLPSPFQLLINAIRPHSPLHDCLHDCLPNRRPSSSFSNSRRINRSRSIPSPVPVSDQSSAQMHYASLTISDRPSIWIPPCIFSSSQPTSLLRKISRGASDP